jgi:hypothetical protein
VTQQVIFEPEYETHILTGGTITGTYYSVGDETEVNEWQPIQPRTSVDISLDDQTPHGAFFEGGTYQTLENFDPVITRVITDTSNISFWEEEPGFDHPGIWQPSWWSLINQVWTPEKIIQRLVVLPGQYRSTTVDTGTERLFDLMSYTLYYSNLTDLVPPSIWNIHAVGQESTGQVSVEVTDLSDVTRVGVSYTLGESTWTTVDLSQNTDNPNQWIGTIPNGETIEWFVQAVDGAGNVAISDNKGAYFGTIDLGVWLPIIYFNYSK